eukprot:Nitzschia sp. Nitz4//scaffold135_size62275//7961//8842//NITZ4_006345-RA/size62275-processed-gene-0.29-mRNA-1//-1//CDS//3329535548//4701//frame0
MGVSLMQQHPDDLRRLELLRLAGLPRRAPMHLGFDLGLSAQGAPHGAVPLSSVLGGPLQASAFLYGGSYPSLVGAVPPVMLPGAPSTAHSISLAPASLLSSSLPSASRVVPPEYRIAGRQELPTDRTPPGADSYQRYQGENRLPADFKPGPNSVIIGRKKHCYTSVGNLRLRDIVLMSLPAYSKCSKKKDKTEVVSSIVQLIRDSCPEGGAFVKCDSEGRWHEVSEVISRERVASIFRDFLHDQYRSSSKSKVAKRREKRAKQILDTVKNDDAGDSQGEENEPSSEDSGDEES